MKEEKKTKKEIKNTQEERIQQLANQVIDLEEKLLRNSAELENFKKRVQQERINERKYAFEPLLLDILEPIEQFSKVVNLDVEDPQLKNFLIGFKMISDQFTQVLKDNNVNEIEALNKPFDPKEHYAIEKENNKDKENGINIEVIRKGYTYKDRILRPALVKVNEWSEIENGENK